MCAVVSNCQRLCACEVKTGTHSIQRRSCKNRNMQVRRIRISGLTETYSQTVNAREILINGPVCSGWPTLAGGARARMSDKRPKLGHLGPPSDLESSSIQQANEVQSSLNAITEEAAAEVLRVHAAANARRAPLFAERARALTAIRGFWRRAILGHGTLERFATKRDREILTHLEDVRVEEAADVHSGFNLILTFNESNPFFSNRVLEKRITWTDGLLRLEASEIAWRRPEYDPEVALTRHDRAAEAAAQAAAAAPGADAVSDHGTGKRSRGQDEACAEDDAPMNSVPTLLMTMLCTELGEHAPLEVGEEDDEDIAERAQLAREAQMICDAIKDDVWLDPISLYEAARIAGEE